MIWWLVITGELDPLDGAAYATWREVSLMRRMIDQLKRLFRRSP